MRLIRSRSFWAIVAALPVALAASLPSTAPGWLFWGSVAIACASAARWGWLDQREPE